MLYAKPIEQINHILSGNVAYTQELRLRSQMCLGHVQPLLSCNLT